MGKEQNYLLPGFFLYPIMFLKLLFHRLVKFQHGVVKYYTDFWSQKMEEKEMKSNIYDFFSPLAHISMGEGNTVVSAYTMLRHLQQYCSHPSISEFKIQDILGMAKRKS